MDFLEVCRKFIAIESTPSTGNVEVATFAGEVCKEIGLHVEFQEGVISGVAQMNVLARPTAIRPPAELLLQTHLDTAEPGIYSLWTETDRNPFNASIRGDKIFGLGAASAKLDYVCKLWAIRELGKRNWRLPFVLVGTYGEETGMLGAKKLMQSNLISAKHALIGEPSGLRLVTASNGIAVLDFFVPFDEQEKAYRSKHSESESTATHSRIFRGKASHSATPEMGENAIVKSIRYLEELPDSIAILTMDGGTFHNIVPDQAYVEVDVSETLHNGAGRRLLGLVKELEHLSTEFIGFADRGKHLGIPTLNYGVVRTYEDGFQLIVSLRMTPQVTEQDLHGWRGRIREFCQGLNVRFRLRDFKLPWQNLNSSGVVGEAQKVLSTMGLPNQFISKSTTNESSVYAQEGIDCLVFGAGSNLGTDHGPNEFNSVSELKTAVEFYRLLIERMCT